MFSSRMIKSSWSVRVEFTYSSSTLLIAIIITGSEIEICFTNLKPAARLLSGLVNA
jgi:hypothetical protein